MIYLFEPRCYLIDQEELNKFSSNQTSLNGLKQLISTQFETHSIEILYPEKNLQSEFETNQFLSKNQSISPTEQVIVSRLKPLHRKIKNLNEQERYLLQILQFFQNDKKALIIDKLSFMHSSNLEVIKGLIQNHLAPQGKTIFIIDRKEELWKKNFHCFENYSITRRQESRLAS